METSDQTPKRHSRGKKLKATPTMIVIVILVAIIAVLAWQYQKQRSDANKLRDPQVAVKRDATELKNKVGQLVDLPKDEEPTVATVNDASKLKSQQFFAKAQNGDKVLIFTKARRAVLYRPSTNKVIEYAPVNIGNTTQGTQSQ